MYRFFSSGTCSARLSSSRASSGITFLAAQEAYTVYCQPFEIEDLPGMPYISYLVICPLRDRATDARQITAVIPLPAVKRYLPPELFSIRKQTTVRIENPMPSSSHFAAFFQFSFIFLL